MRIDILTLFPEMFKGPFDESIVKRAQEKKLVEIKIYNLRDWATDKRKTVDDKPYGGGTGMVMMIDPIDKALEEIKKQKSQPKAGPPLAEKIILLSPRGKVFSQKIAQEFALLDNLILICGHYEGVDERVSEHLVDEEISIGDYVLTGGEIPAMIIVDSVTRLLPGVLTKPSATSNESFSPYNLQPTLRLRSGQATYNLLEYPHYTRPEDYKGWKVPEVLLSGNHKKIEEWRKQKSLAKTQKTRPDLLK